MYIQEQQSHEPSLPKTNTSRNGLHEVNYAAAFSARLALARWTRGGDIPHVFSSVRNLPARAVWYAEAERQFQAWLERGGFHAE